MAYRVDILNASRSYLATLKNLAPLDQQGYFLRYTERLNDWGVARFRVGTEDPIFASEGYILEPFTNHVRILDDGVTVWQGVIVRCPSRNKRYVEVEARSYLYLLSRTLVNHDPADGAGAENYRTFRSGTMAANISTLVTEAKARMGAPLTGLTTGTITNPSFPSDYKDTRGQTLTGDWTFSDYFQMKVDYRDLLYVLRQFGLYSNSDYEIDLDFALNFETHIGRRSTDIVFTYGEFGNIDDFNAPLDGDSMANFLQGIASDNQGLILHAELSDLASINANGRIEGVAPYADVKNNNLLLSRLRQELTQVKTSDPELNFFANEKTHLPGEYGVGDVVRVTIDKGAINSNSLRRIVGRDIDVHTSGTRRTRIITNKPREDV